MITVRYTPAVRKSVDLQRALERPVALATALAAHVRRRVSELGETATPAEPYKANVFAERAAVKADLASARAAGQTWKAAQLAARSQQLSDRKVRVRGTSKRSYRISAEYARALGLERLKYRSSADFHTAAKTKLGTFRVTGGMWRGLGVRASGSTRATLAFYGSSLGGSGGKRGGRVPNRFKAGTVFDRMGVNIVQPTDDENAAMVSAVCRWAQVAVAKAFGATIGEYRSEGDQRLLAAILRKHDGV